MLKGVGVRVRSEVDLEIGAQERPWEVEVKELLFLIGAFRGSLVSLLSARFIKGFT